MRGGVGDEICGQVLAAVGAARDAFGQSRTLVVVVLREGKERGAAEAGGRRCGERDTRGGPPRRSQGAKCGGR